uniref:NAC domain-containing protein n=1 Tax=Ananas comosus var. bracteatus TaxID=296719 RepID=A0A6V7PC93_ANACO|nr:unnamed protein product [Ananas comosus var. bracteatus]
MAQQQCPSCGGTGRLRQSDSLHGGTEPLPLSETTDQASVAPCYKFTPTDQQLILDFLTPYAKKRPIPGKHIVVEQVYGNGGKEPSELLGRHRDTRYLFTTRPMCNGRVNRTMGPGGGGRRRRVENLSRQLTARPSSAGRKRCRTLSMGGAPVILWMSMSSLNPLLTVPCGRSQRIDSQRRRAKEPVPAPVISSEQDHHDGAFKIGGSMSPPPLLSLSFERATRPMHLFTAAEASLKGIARTEAINYASADQIMPSSAVDQQLSLRGGNWWMEEMPNNNIFYPSKASELDMIPAELEATAEHHSPPLSGQGGEIAIYTGDLGWMTLSNSGYWSPLPDFNWEPSPSKYQLWPEDHSDVLWS